MKRREFDGEWFSLLSITKAHRVGVSLCGLQSWRVARTQYMGMASGDCDVLAEIDILNCIQDFHAFVHRALECLAAGNESHAARPLVDDGRTDCFGKIIFTRS